MPDVFKHWGIVCVFIHVYSLQGRRVNAVWLSQVQVEMFSLQWRKYERQFDVKSLCKFFFFIFKNNIYCALVLRLNRKSSAKVQERARPTSGSSSISWSCSPVTGRWTVVCVRVVAQAPDPTCEVKKQLNHRFTTVPMFHLCLWTSGSDRKDKDTDTSGWNVCLRSCQAPTRGGAFKFFTSFISSSKEQFNMKNKTIQCFQNQEWKVAERRLMDGW